MAAKRLKLGVVVGFLVVGESGEVVICDTDTTGAVVAGDTVAISPRQRARPVQVDADAPRVQRLRDQAEQARALLAQKTAGG